MMHLLVVDYRPIQLFDVLPLDLALVLVLRDADQCPLR